MPDNKNPTPDMPKQVPADRSLLLSQTPVLEQSAGWTLDLLLADPSVVLRHFPADRYGPPSLCVAAEEFRRQPAGTVGFVDGETQARCPEVAFNVLRSYRLLMWLLGMSVDHHGWLFWHRDDGISVDVTLTRLEPLMPRILRCLWLLELRGYSASGYLDRHGYSYARSLAEKLVAVLDLSHSKGHLATECAAILAEP